MDRSNAGVDKDSTADSDSSDDISLTKLKEKLTAGKKRECNPSTSTNNKKAGCLDTDASSDNEPLIKVTLQAGKKVESGPGKISVDKEDDDSSDDEPLSVLAAKLKPKHEANVKNSGVGAKVVESKITATRKRVKLAEPSSDSSDEETLATVKQKLLKTDGVQKAPPKQKKIKLKESSSKDSSSEEDNLPLVHFIAKNNNTKRKVDPQVSASGKSRGSRDSSSEDEPLINLVKKRQAQSKVKTPEKMETQPKRLEEKLSTDSSSDDDSIALANLVNKMKSRKEIKTAKSKLQDGESTKRRVSEGSSEEEPLINLVKKRNMKTPQRKTRSPKKKEEKHVADFSSESSSDDDLPLAELKAKRMLGKENGNRKVETQVSASRKRQEIPEGSSEDEPLINLVKKKKMQPTVKTPQTKTRRPKKQEEKHVADLSSDSSSDDDDLPLAELKAKRMLGKENAKRKVKSQVSTSRKRQEISDPSSEDEPLINLVKKSRQSKVKAPTVLREQQVHAKGSTNNRSDEEPAKKDANHPQLTKFVKIILGRCDGEETARSHNETGRSPAADVS